MTQQKFSIDLNAKSPAKIVIDLSAPQTEEATTQQSAFFEKNNSVLSLEQTPQPNTVSVANNSADFFDVEQKKADNEKKQKNMVYLNNVYTAFPAVLITGYVFAMFYQEVQNIQNSAENTLFDKAKFVLKSADPRTVPGLFKIIVGGMCLGCIALALKHKDKIVKNIKWNKQGGQTVLPAVFEKLVFKNAPQNPALSTPYSALDRVTLEKEIQRFDLSLFSADEQQLFLQNLIDLCDKNPAQAKLFRMDIFNLRLKREKLEDGILAHYDTDDGIPYISSPPSQMIEPPHFIHELAHAVQDKSGLSLENEEPFYALAAMFMEAQAHAYEYLCFEDETDPLFGKLLLRQSQQEIKDKITNSEITVSSHLDEQEKSRVLLGLAQERTAGKLMELFLALPSDVSKRLVKNLFKSKYPVKRNKLKMLTQLTEAKHRIAHFHTDYAYENKDAFLTMIDYPNATKQFVQIYSNIFGYEIELSDPHKAEAEFEHFIPIIKAEEEKELQQEEHNSPKKITATRFKREIQYHLNQKQKEAL